MISEASAGLKKVVREQIAPNFAANVPLQVQRDTLVAMGEQAEYPKELTLKEERLNNVPGAWFSFPDVIDDRYIIYYHGGGFSMGGIKGYGGMATNIALHTRAKVFMPDYRLVPEHPFPAGLNDCIATYEGLLAEGVSSDSIILCGESAGGSLLFATILALKEKGVSLPKALFAMSPWVDLTCLSKTYEENRAEDPWLTPELMRSIAHQYAPNFDPTIPAASPLFGDISGFPPTLIHVGGAEIIQGDSIAFTEKAKRAGVDISLKVWDELWHVFHFFAPACPEGVEALKEIGDFVEKHLG